MKRTLSTLLILALTLPTFGQGRNQKEPESPRLVENIDVRVINIDVVVTDKRGNPITGLKKEDFEIRENNILKVISNFYAVAGGRATAPDMSEAAPEPAPAPVPQTAAQVPEEQKRRIIFYVDNLSLAPFNRNRVFAQMKQFVKDVMRPGDEAMIATYNRSMKVRVPFTRDTKAIETMLDSLSGESGLGISARSDRKTAEDRIAEAQSYTEALQTARTYAQAVEHDLRQSVSSINALMTTLAGVEGKKILVLTSEGFPMQPGREAFYMVEETAREKGWQNTSTVIEGMSFNSTNLIQQVAKTANANGITLYTLHAAGLVGGTEMSAEHARPIPPSVSNAAQQNSAESMMMMAEMTGGLASVNTNNFNLAFQRINRDLESYYSLGYRAGTERVDRQRYINVRVKNRKDVIVRNRQTFVEKSVFAEMSDRAVANLLYQVKDNDLKILARLQRATPTEDGYFRVPVDIMIPMTSLTLMPQGTEEFVGGFDVYVVVANKDNDMSDVARKSHQIRVPAAAMKTIDGKHYTYTLDMLMEKGLNKVSIGVVDQISNQTGFTREQIIAQAQ
ncbi:MAG TPA: VWA domain-containing protein [Thermoanaerobaculia bacterium]|nr:VWA domain-containing protein [Thermoanaerobaculia bacterium]